MNKYGLEARELWIQARIDELMDSTDFVMRHQDCAPVTLFLIAKTQATREHATVMADLEDERINAVREY